MTKNLKQLKPKPSGFAPPTPQLDPLLLQHFQAEIAWQCQLAILAYQDLEEALDPTSPQLIDNKRIWYSIQSLLIAIANVSKILWPQPNSKLSGEKKLLREARNAKLRTHLCVSDKSPLSDRKFRNHFEHFDERLEDWFTASTNHNMVMNCIGDGNLGANFHGFDPKDILRYFNKVDCQLFFRGETYELKPVIQEIKNLYNVVNTSL